MEDGNRARPRRWAQIYILIGSLCLFVGTALLLYGNLSPVPHPRYAFDMGGFGRYLAGLGGVGLTLSGAVLVGVVVLSADLDPRRP
jgi:hypothetical protein